MQKVLPEAVYTVETIADEVNGQKSDEHLAIHYGNTVGLLVEAIKELEARVKELEGKIMATPASGAISLNQIHVEAGGASGTACTINDADIRLLAGVGNNATAEVLILTITGPQTLLLL